MGTLAVIRGFLPVAPFWLKAAREALRALVDMMEQVALGGAVHRELVTLGTPAALERLERTVPIKEAVVDRVLEQGQMGRMRPATMALPHRAGAVMAAGARQRPLPRVTV